MSIKVHAIQVHQRFLWPDWFHDAVSANKIITHGMGKFGSGRVYCEIPGDECILIAEAGDWIVNFDNGDFMTITDRGFRKYYEAIEPTEVLS